MIILFDGKWNECDIRDIAVSLAISNITFKL